METKSFKYEGKSVFYRWSGKGPCVLLLHGFGEDGTIWDELTNELTDNYKLIIPDLPGSGLSQMLSSTAFEQSENVSGGERPGQANADIKINHPTIEDFADVIKAILDNELAEESVLIGHSMGGYIALAFAEMYPDKLSGLGLFHSSAFADDEAKIESRLKAVEFIKGNGAYAFLKTSIPNLFADIYKEKKSGRINALIDAGKTFTSESLIQYYYAMINRPDRTRILETFSKPVLFIIGENDTAIPLKTSLLQCHLPEISHVHILQDVGHMGMLENQVTSRLISSFLSYSIGR